MTTPAAELGDASGNAFAEIKLNREINGNC